MSRFFIRLLILFISALLFFYLGFSLTMRFSLIKNKDIIVPEVIGKTETEALKKAKEVSLGLIISERRYDLVRPEGIVLSQNPPAKSKGKRGQRLFVVISKGIEPVAIPFVSGMAYSQAKMEIESSGLKVGHLCYVPSYDNKETIIATSPNSEQVVAKETQVDLLISNGLRSNAYVTPWVTGKGLKEARNLLVSSNILYHEKIVHMANVPNDSVVKQIPQAGYPNNMNDPIEIWVNKK